MNTWLVHLTYIDLLLQGDIPSKFASSDILIVYSFSGISLMGRALGK